ncbi:hypothetical protein JCM11251_007974 [Rhodosporidiobolus azoricus]
MPSVASRMLLDTPLGDGVRLLTGTRWLRYEEEQDGFDFEQARRSEVTEKAMAPVVESPGSLPAQGPAAGASVSGATTLCEQQVVTWYGKHDPAYPHNWSFVKKAWVSFVIGFYTFAIYVGGGIVTTGYKSMMAQFGAQQQVVYLSMSLFIFAYGFGALLWCPLSEMPRFGRNPWYWGPGVIAVGLQLGAALTPSFAGLAVLRFMVGFLGSSILATGGASLGDIWGTHYLPLALAPCWVLPAFNAPALAPTITVFAVERWDWRWTMWVNFFLIAPSVILLLLIPETSAETILHRRAARLRYITGNNKLRTRNELENEGRTAKTLLYEALSVPFKVTLLDPSILFAALYIGLCYGVFFSFFESFPIVFGETYPFTPVQETYAFLCVSAGTLVGLTTYLSYQIFYMYPWIAKNGTPPQERRLDPAVLSSMTAAMALFIFAWTAYPHLHWFGPVFGGGLFVASNNITFQCVFYYIILSYPKYAASILAANDFIRSTVGSVLVSPFLDQPAHFFSFSLQIAALLVHASSPLFRSRVGVHGGVSLLGGLASCGIVGIVTLRIFGAKLRARSQFAVGPGGREDEIERKAGKRQEEA